MKAIESKMPMEPLRVQPLFRFIGWNTFWSQKIVRQTDSSTPYYLYQENPLSFKKNFEDLVKRKYNIVFKESRLTKIPFKFRRGSL